MSRTHAKYKPIIAATAALVMYSIPGAALADRAADLLADLRAAPDAAQAERLEKELRLEWSKSGSAAMDLLLKRGRDALEVQDTAAAIEHLTALTDHAPGFAEGWAELALAYYSAEMLGPSMDALEHTLALNPDHFGALQGVAAIYEQLGDTGLAYRAYSQVLDLRPHDETVTEAMQRLETEVRGTAL